MVNGYDYWKDTSKGAKYFSWSLPSLKQLKEDFKSDGPFLGFYYKNGVIPLEIAEDSMYRTVYDHELEYDFASSNRLSQSDSLTPPPTNNLASCISLMLNHALIQWTHSGTVFLLKWQRPRL